MNIFEFLGLPKDHRKEGKVTQLVKHYDEVSEKHKGKKLFGQVKKDGVCTLMLVFKGRAHLFSRTGKKFTNVSYVENMVAGSAIPEGMYMGELCCREASLEVLSGVVNPKRVNKLSADQEIVSNTLKLFLFDLITIKEFIQGASDVPYIDRYHNLKLDLILLSTPSIAATLHTLKVEVLHNENDFEAFLNRHVGSGEEGVVYRDPYAGWEAGHKGWRVMKKVRGVDYDLRCIGLEEGTGKYTGKVANLLFAWKDGKIIKCMLGKGWTHDMAEKMFIRKDELDTPIGKIFQVYALEESSKGKLRLPKVGEMRHDKDEADF